MAHSPSVPEAREAGMLLPAAQREAPKGTKMSGSHTCVFYCIVLPLTCPASQNGKRPKPIKKR